MFPKFENDTIELYLDLDGVFADFDQKVFDLCGQWPNDLQGKEGSRKLWSSVNRCKTFFFDLQMISNANTLWEYCNQYKNKRVLTGAPRGQAYQDQKIQWVRKHLCTDIEVLVVPSRDKYLHAGPGKILLDDRVQMTVPWAEAGGTSVLHDHRDIKSSIDILESIRLSNNKVS